MTLRQIWSSLVAAFLVSWSVVAAATVVKAASLAQLVAASDSIVVGMPVDASSSYASLGGSKLLVTDTRIEISRSLRGQVAVGQTLRVRTLGGRIGEIAQIVPGEARLDLGQSCLLFLRKNRSGLFRVAGMAQGQYPLWRDAAGTLRLRASQNLDKVLDPAGSGAVHLLSGRTLSEVEGLVRLGTSL